MDLFETYSIKLHKINSCIWNEIKCSFYLDSSICVQSITVFLLDPFQFSIVNFCLFSVLGVRIQSCSVKGSPPDIDRVCKFNGPFIWRSTCEVGQTFLHWVVHDFTDYKIVTSLCGFGSQKHIFPKCTFLGSKLNWLEKVLRNSEISYCWVYLINSRINCITAVYFKITIIGGKLQYDTTC